MGLLSVYMYILLEMKTEKDFIFQNRMDYTHFFLQNLNIRCVRHRHRRESAGEL